MRLKLQLTPMSDEEPEVVLVGMVIGRRWETEHGENVSKGLETRPSSTLVELAHLGWQRKHGRTLSIGEFEDRFEVDVIASESEADNPPFDPATAQ